jgi:uncharacterized membrane protein YoaK (UPF0700 family)
MSTEALSPDAVPVALLIVLTVTTGIVDAVSVLALGHVFTANMTGNVVFLGFALAGAPEFSLKRSGFALISFLAGAAGGGQMASRMAAKPVDDWVGRALIVEGVLMLAAAAACTACPGRLDDTSGTVAIVICLTALAMGFRNATVRRLGVADLTTTLLTLTLTGLAADSYLAGGTNPRWRRRTASILGMFAGGFSGVFLLKISVALALGVSGLVSTVCAAFLKRRSLNLSVISNRSAL